MKRFKLILLSFLCLSFGFCVTSRVAPYPGHDYTPTHIQDIFVYAIPPDYPFEIIGEVEARGAVLASWSSIEYWLKKEASHIGGDAVILIDRREVYTGTYAPPSTKKAIYSGGYLYYTATDRKSSVIMKKKHVLGLVIRWKKK